MNIQLPPKVQSFLDKLNSNGIKLPMLTDCLTGNPSLTYTLTLIASICVLLGCIHSTEHLVDFNKSVNFLQLVGGAYLARKTMAHVAPLNNNTEKEDNTNETN